MESAEDQIEKEPKPGLTLRRILICSLILGIVVVAISAISNYRRDQTSKGCLARFSNLNKALVLYRADADGYSPGYDRIEVIKPDEKLSKYAGSGSILCPSEFQLFPPTLRISRGGKDHSILRTGLRPLPYYVHFGIEENSVVAECDHHLKYSSKFNFSRLPSPYIRSEYLSGGSYNILLRSGTARQVRFNAGREQWLSRDGESVPANNRPPSWTSFSSTTLFDFEPKPPQFEY